MTRRSRSSVSAYEDQTFVGKIVELNVGRLNKVETCAILMKNDWRFQAKISNFIDACYRRSLAMNDIVQFRLMDLENEKIPICIDEATPYQREEFEGKKDVSRVLTENKINRKSQKIESEKIARIETNSLKKLSAPKDISRAKQETKPTTKHIEKRKSRIENQENIPSDKVSNVDSKSSADTQDVHLEVESALNQSSEGINKYEWSGQRLVGRDHKIFYTSLKITGNGESVEIKTGNHITIENQDNRKQPFVAKINKFFEDTKKETDKKRVLVEWYLRVDDCNQIKRTDREAEKDEIFLYTGSGIPKNIDVETILWKCSVYDFEHRGKIKKANRHQNRPTGEQTYFCRAFFDAKRGYADLTDLYLTKLDKPPKDLPSPKKQSPKKISKTNLLEAISQSSEDESSDDQFSSKSSSKSSSKNSSVKNYPTRTRKLSTETTKAPPNSEQVLPRRSRRISSDSDTKLESKTKSSRRSLFDEPDCDNEVNQKPSRMAPKSKRSKPKEDHINETPSKPLARLLDSNCVIQTPKSRATRRKTTALTTITETPQKTPKKRPKPSSTVEMTPTSKLASDLENLAVRRSTRRSAVQATANILEQQYRPPDSSESDSNGSSGDPTSDEDEDMAEQIMKTPKKKARPWRGAKTPTKNAPKTPKHLPKTPSKRGNAPSMFEQKSAPKRVVLPDFIVQSNDLMKILGQASTRLDINSVPDSLPCRESEYQSIFNFIEDKLNHNTGGCLYISGVPGTGKTATTQEVIAAIRKEVEEEHLPKFKYVELNGMRMTRPKQAYAAIWSQLTGEKRTADHASELLEEKFEARRMNQPILMLVDELDQLMTRKQDVLYRILDWPQRSKIIVLAIANTFDLPERVMQRRVQSRLGLSRETFSPYTFNQLEEIIKSRLGKNLSRLFEETGIAFIARKVASLSGDARRALEICRQAVEQSMIRYEQTKDPSSVYIRLKDVIKAVEAISCNPAIKLMQSAPLQAKIFLRGVVASFRSSGIEEASIEEVIEHCGAICHVDGFKKANYNELLTTANWLESCSFILADNLKHGIHAKVRLTVSPEDILFALNKE